MNGPGTQMIRAKKQQQGSDMVGAQHGDTDKPTKTKGDQRT